MNQKQAFKIASQNVHIIRNGGYGFDIYGPYDCAHPNGATAEQHAGSYRRAVRRASGWKAAIAGALLGLSNDEICELEQYVCDCEDVPNWRAAVREAVALAK